jgi:hypothetical protein
MIIGLKVYQPPMAGIGVGCGVPSRDTRGLGCNSSLWGLAGRAGGTPVTMRPVVLSS